MHTLRASSLESCRVQVVGMWVLWRTWRKKFISRFRVIQFFEIFICQLELGFHPFFVATMIHFQHCNCEHSKHQDLHHPTPEPRHFTEKYCMMRKSHHHIATVLTCTIIMCCAMSMDVCSCRDKNRLLPAVLDNTASQEEFTKCHQRI